MASYGVHDKLRSPGRPSAVLFRCEPLNDGNEFLREADGFASLGRCNVRCGAGFVIGGGFQAIGAGQKRSMLAFDTGIGFGQPREFALTPW